MFVLADQLLKFLQGAQNEEASWKFNPNKNKKTHYGQPKNAWNEDGFGPMLYN